MQPTPYKVWQHLSDGKPDGFIITDATDHNVANIWYNHRPELEQTCKETAEFIVESCNTAANLRPNGFNLPERIADLKTRTHTQVWIECKEDEPSQELLAAAAKFGEPRTFSTIAVSVDSFMMDDLSEVDPASTGETLLKEVMEEASKKEFWEVVFFVRKA